MSGTTRDCPSVAHASLRSPRRARRQDGAVRGLRDARAISARRAERASVDARKGGSVRRRPTWGRRSLVAEDGQYETVAEALEALVPADIASLKPGQQRYSQLLGDDGGILDDLMVLAAGRGAGRRHAAIWSSTPAARTPTTRTSQARLPAGVMLRIEPASGADGAAGAGRCRRAGAAVAATLAAYAVHDWHSSPTIGGVRHATSRARATPARTASRSRSESVRRPRRFGKLLSADDPACNRSASARVTVSASKPGSASTATTSTRRRRRSRPGSPGRSRSGGASRAASPAPRASRRNWPTVRRACASASSPRVARRLAKAPRSCDGMARRSASSHRAASARASTARSPWAMSRPRMPSPARPYNWWCAASRCRRPSSRCRSSPHRYKR